jgi:hypothetical protein
MNLNYLIRLNYWGTVCAVYFCLSTSLRAEVLQIGRGDLDTKKFAQEKINLDRTSIYQSADGIAQGITKVTGVQLERTEDGLQIILETSKNGNLVPLIIPEGKSLVIRVIASNSG